MHGCLRWGGMALALLVATAGPPAARGAETTVRVNAFPGSQPLTILAAQSKGFFGKRGLVVELQLTPSSQAQRDGLAQGKFEIAHAAVDNAVAMVEVAKVDVVIVLGGDNGLNVLAVQPEIRSYADLRGKTVAVDAPNTAYALLLYKMFALNGLQKGDYSVKAIGATAFRLEAMRKDKSYAATMLNPPFTALAEKEGLRSFGTAVQAIGAYQGPGAFVLRSWAKANADTLVRYIQGYVEGQRWMLNPANKSEVVAFIADRLKLSPDIAEKTYAVIADPVSGFSRDAKLDVEGFKNTLKLRAEIEGQGGGTPPPPERYLDLTFYERALAGL